MRLTIHQIVLYPRNDSLSPRSITFEPGVVNIITGTSRRGKSAVGHIIDYCLGAGKCAIPVGEIRNAVSWYCILIELNGTFITAARKDPGAQQSTDEYFYFESPYASLPLAPQSNSNRATFKARFDELTGLPSVGTARDDSSSGFDDRASFRDMAAFNFLPQHIVANPHTLFAKTDSYEHREKLRRIFPLVLGAIDSDYLTAQQEDRELRKQSDKLRAEHERHQAAADSWRAEMAGLFSRAQELGLIAPNLSSPAQPASLLASLRTIADAQDIAAAATLTQGSTEHAVQELNRLLNVEEETARALADMRRQLQRLTGLSTAVIEYGSELGEQRDRVTLLPWLQGELSDDECPFCGMASDRAATALSSMTDAAVELDRAIASAAKGPSVFQRQEAQLRIEIHAAEESLQRLRQQRVELEDTSDGARRARQRIGEMYRVAGRIDQALRNIDDTDESGELVVRMAVVRERLVELQATLNQGEMERRLESALTQISANMRDVANILQLERRDDVVRLIPKELALVFEGTNRRDYLWELGSGENWMGYHIALFAALHEYWLGRQDSPVPTFLVIDQPTQVYFPARNDAYETARSRAHQAGPDIDNDIARARRIFEALSRVITRTQGKLQIIVTEHADDTTWGGIEHLHEVENWRHDNYLIPLSWIE